MVQNSVSISARTDVGRVREHNEDNFIVCADLSAQKWLLQEKPFQLTPAGCLLVVADGMGGANAGEVASHIAVEQVKQFFQTQQPEAALTENQEKAFLGKAILLAHQAIVAHAAAHPDCAGMGTTILVAWVKPWRAVIAWCGDSRAYLYRPKEGIKIITRDHSLVWELVEAGQITSQQADVHPNSNIITQSLGDPHMPPKPDTLVLSLQPLDRLLLCSDGLNNMVALEEIEQIFFQDKPLPEINQTLIEAANRNGGKDNITVVSLQVLADAFPAEQPAAPKRSHKKVIGIIMLIMSAVAVLLFWNPVKELLNAGPTNPTNKAADKNGMISVKKAGVVPVKTDAPPPADQTGGEGGTDSSNRAGTRLAPSEGGLATGPGKPVRKSIQASKTKVQPSKKEPVNQLDEEQEIELEDKIFRIKNILSERNRLSQLNEQEFTKSGEENKFYEEEVKKVRAEMKTLLEGLDSIILAHKWPDLIVDYEAAGETKESLLQVLMKWPNNPEQDNAMGQAEKIIDLLNQQQLKLKQ